MADQVALIVHRILLAAHDHPCAPSPQLHERVRQYIDEHLTTPLALEKLARVFHYSQNHIINIFRSSYSCTPYTYYEKQKMLAAR